ncbi:hypothetical protein [Cyclobacterium xiamenense]|jgi:Na+/melibiose symporter-like transporter|uniref:hypothetical protein n=1 Tax=Cyclobacterium xiamenense TaxID=1297121 RepID=UPI0012B93F13|nr:hypothetical protein [Cyclobacterium xiamenense]
MKETIHTSLQTLSLIAVIGLLAWYFIGSSVPTHTLFTWMILLLIVTEIASLILIGGSFPESYTSLKVGIIAALFILLGIKNMLPSFFIPLTITLMALNFLYNFYTSSKRKKGGYKRRRKPLRN